VEPTFEGIFLFLVLAHDERDQATSMKMMNTSSPCMANISKTRISLCDHEIPQNPV